MAHVKEEQIRPAALFDTYLALAEEDAKWLLSVCVWETVDCWACDKALEKQFRKLHFDFGE